MSLDQVKELRSSTGMSIIQCKQALEEANGDMKSALDKLRAKGAAVAKKKSERSLGAGVVSAYIHNNKQIGTLVELMCETDFVAKNEEFVSLANDIAMHMCAMDPADVVELLAQPFIKDSSKSIKDLIETATQKFGERTEIGRISRYSIK